MANQLKWLGKIDKVIIIYFYFFSSASSLTALAFIIWQSVANEIDGHVA